MKRTLACCLLVAAALVTAVPLKTDHVDDVKLLSESEGMMPDLDLSGGLSGQSMGLRPITLGEGQPRSLGEANGPTDLMHALDQQAGTEEGKAAFDGTGRHDRGPDSGIHNMAGAPYGLPGYKESHDWVNDVDIFSPLVFNWEYYGQGLATPVTTEIESKTAWQTYLADSSIKFPNCVAGTPDFDVVDYMRNNEYTSSSCGEGIEMYLSQGVYSGYKDTIYSASFTDYDNNERVGYAIGLNTAKQLYPRNTFKPSKTFTWSFWYKDEGTNPHSWNDIFGVSTGTWYNNDFYLQAGGSSYHTFEMLVDGHNIGNWGWFGCAPDDNGRATWGSDLSGYLTRESGPSPGFETGKLYDNKNWWHWAYTMGYDTDTDRYTSKFFVNGKKCFTSKTSYGSNTPKISTWAANGGEPGSNCISNGGSEDCGGPWVGHQSWWSYSVAEMAYLKYFTEELTEGQITAMYDQRNVIACLKNQESCA
jgi:hypothetical protein